MAIKKNEVTTNLKINKSLLNSKKDDEKKVGRKSFNDEKLKADKRNTFLLNFYQQEKMENRMQELGIRNKTEYILTLLKKDIIEL
jgi:hypothetical protein